ncbi:MAG: GNAT family N-acetyltransferase [Cyanobacteriota bacterium]|jgi:ribosomal-protein-alanine N-acetyltransferase
MGSFLQIRALERRDIPFVTEWARREGCAPGLGDVAIYHHTDRQGLWMGWLGQEPVGCIAGVRYNAAYGFVGMFLVVPEHRGNGHGVALWRHALEHLEDLPCVGLEAAPERVDDYAGWGFAPASPTSRWQRISGGDEGADADASQGESLALLEGEAIPERAVQWFDAQREATPRPHFLGPWLQHPAGTVLALVDGQGACHGFGRIRPCLLQRGEGWRIGPLLADTPSGAQRLLEGLLRRHPGVVLIDAPGANPAAATLLAGLGFRPISSTLRMYRGAPPQVPLNDVYGLACLELG